MALASQTTSKERKVECLPPRILIVQIQHQQFQALLSRRSYPRNHNKAVRWLLDIDSFDHRCNNLKVILLNFNVLQTKACLNFSFRGVGYKNSLHRQEELIAFGIIVVSQLRNIILILRSMVIKVDFNNLCLKLYAVPFELCILQFRQQLFSSV